jgi:glyoxylase-like metal-dependent hydrolase (beta-lactamase superfamily II)
MNLICPSYKTTTWAQHNHRLSVSHPRLEVIPMHLPVTTLHTPGHTPDSLSWFDEEERALYVGDSLYEAPVPILFPSEGNLADWWRSVDLLIAFVMEKNEVQSEKRVTLSAGHVTVGVDALGCLTEAKEFMKRVLRDEVSFEEQPLKRGEPFGQWQEDGRFSLGAPLRVIQEGRLGIPEEEWRSNV